MSHVCLVIATDYNKFKCPAVLEVKRQERRLQSLQGSACVVTDPAADSDSVITSDEQRLDPQVVDLGRRYHAARG